MRRIYREAMISDKMSSAYPVNKNGTPSALRMMHVVGSGVGVMAGEALAGHPGAAVGAMGGTLAAGALESPAAWKAGMKGALAVKGQAKVSQDMARAMVAGALATPPLLKKKDEGK